MRILAVGIATLDRVCRVRAYPAEDAEVRAESLQVSRGGNATNTLSLLQALGHRCAWAGMLADDPDSEAIVTALNGQGIDLAWVRRHPGGGTPTSLVWTSVETGSRTIVHYRDLPEYPATAFRDIDLDRFDWVHFEGRAVAELAAMLAHLKTRGGPPCSLEIEKPREGIEALLALPDLLLTGRHYANSRGYASAPALLRAWRQAGLHQPMVCAWGEQGAWALDAAGQLHHAPAMAPERVVDTLGAGDVFNAGVIHHWLAGLPLPEVLTQAVALAGRKCGQVGFDGLVESP